MRHQLYGTLVKLTIISRFFAVEAMENVKPLCASPVARALPGLQDDTGRGAGPFLGSPSPLTLGVHYTDTGRGAGPTPRAAPRSLTSR